MNDNSFEWVDGQHVMQKLLISARTLQTFRTNGTLPFSRIGKKIYYKRSDIEQVLQNNYIMFNLRDKTVRP